MAMTSTNNIREVMRIGCRLLCTALLLVGAIAHATDDESAWTFSGFGTLGLVYNPSDQFGFTRDLTQKGGARDGISAEVDSILGAQVNYRFSPEIEGVVQIVSRNDQNGFLPADLTWAFLKYEPSPEWAFRVGRTGSDIFMLSDSKDVGYSYTWIRPPFEYFGLQQLNHRDGFDVSYTRPWGNGVFWVKLYGGLADEKLPLDDDADYDLGGSSIFGGHVNYQVGDWWFRLGYARFELENELEELQPFLAFLRGFNPVSRALAEDIGLADKTGKHVIAGVVYENGPLQIQAMADRSTSESRLFHDFYSGYLTVSYRVQKWTPYLSYARIDSHESPRASGFPPGSPTDQGIQSLLASGRADQRTTAIGVRYELRRNVALKFQVDHLKAADATSSLTWNPDADWDGQETVISATMDFIF